MNTGLEQKPFSVSELAVSGIALASVALIAFIGASMSLPQIPAPVASAPPAALAPSAAPAAPAQVAATPPWGAALAVASPPRARSSETSGGASRALQFAAPPAEPESPLAVEAAAEKMPAPVATEPPAERMPAPAAVPPAKPGSSPTQPGGFIEMLRNDDGEPASPWKLPDPAPPSKLADPAPKPAPDRNVLNRSDAAAIQRRLRDLGYYFGDSNGTWGVESRKALRDFKRANGLPDDDQWDRETKQRLLSGTRVQARRTFVGRWALDSEECVQRDDAGRLVIDARGAETTGGKCDFQSLKQENATSWRVRAICSVSGQSWNADIGLRLVGPTLQWSSERGTETYVRCLKS